MYARRAAFRYSINKKSGRFVSPMVCREITGARHVHVESRKGSAYRIQVALADTAVNIQITRLTQLSKFVFHAGDYKHFFFLINFGNLHMEILYRLYLHLIFIILIQFDLILYYLF